jgi:formate dehydrogenase subunit gamma
MRGPDFTSQQSAKLPRFVLAERISHWLYALFFLAAFVSGILMWIPATRAWMGGARFALSHYHGFVGWLMVLVPVILLLILDRRRLAEDIHEVDAWDGDDSRWFWAAVRGRTLRNREMPPQGRLNAGQKASTILVAAMAVGFALTGTLLLLRADLPPWLVSRALWLHGFLAIASVALFVGHLGHVFLTRHGRVYLSAMVGGALAEDTARDRHVKWWEATKKEEEPPPR